MSKSERPQARCDAAISATLYGLRHGECCTLQNTSWNFARFRHHFCSQIHFAWLKWCEPITFFVCLLSTVCFLRPLFVPYSNLCVWAHVHYFSLKNRSAFKICISFWGLPLFFFAFPRACSLLIFSCPRSGEEIEETCVSAVDLSWCVKRLFRDLMV